MSWGRSGTSKFWVVIGRGEKIRTSDHLNPIQVRYQAALRPVEELNHTGTHLWPEPRAKKNRGGPGTTPAFAKTASAFDLLTV